MRSATGTYALAALGLAGAAALSGCGDSDACKGQKGTCISITLDGESGVTEADRLVVMVQRKAKPDVPAMAIDSPLALPFKVAVLWPDGAGTLSVRSYLQGTLNGVTSEIALDLRNGVHEKRKLTLYPPLPGTVGTPDMKGNPPSDMRMPPRDMRGPEDDMATPDDMTMPPPDLSGPGPDLSPLPDLSGPIQDLSSPTPIDLATPAP